MEVLVGITLCTVLRCRGDRLSVETENDDTEYICGLNRTGVSFTPREGELEKVSFLINVDPIFCRYFLL